MISRQLVVFGIVGLLSAALDIGAMQALILAGMPYQAAVTIGFVVGLIFNYSSHANVTFKARISTSTALKYITIVLLNYCITLLSVIVSQHTLGNVLIGKVVSLPIIAANGFLFGKYWVFK